MFKKIVISYLFLASTLFLLFVSLTMQIFFFITTLHYLVRLNCIFDSNFKFIVNFILLIEYKFILLNLLVFLVSIVLISLLIYKILLRPIDKIVFKLFLYCLLSYFSILTGSVFFIKIIMKVWKLRKTLSSVDFNNILLNVETCLVLCIIIIIIAGYFLFIIAESYFKFDSLEKKEINLICENYEDKKKIIKIKLFITSMPFGFLAINCGLFTYFILNFNSNSLIVPF